MTVKPEEEGGAQGDWLEQSLRGGVLCGAGDGNKLGIQKEEPSQGRMVSSGRAESDLCEDAQIGPENS